MPFSEASYIRLGETHRSLEFFADGFPGSFHLGAADEEGLILRKTIELSRILAYGCIALMLYGSENIANDGVDLRGVDGATLLKLLDRRIRSRGLGTKCLQNLHRIPCYKTTIATKQLCSAGIQRFQFRQRPSASESHREQDEFPKSC